MSLRNSWYDCVVPFSTKYAYVVATIAIDSSEVNPAECLCRDRTLARWREVKVFGMRDEVETFTCVYLDRAFGGDCHHCPISRDAFASALQSESLSTGAACLSNLRQISLALKMYEEDHQGELHTFKGQIPNHGMWFSNPRSPHRLDKNDPKAYWAIAYADYYGQQPKLFRCSAARVVDDWRATYRFPMSFWLNSSYGINGQLEVGSLPKLSRFMHPSKTILVQDSAEQKMEGSTASYGSDNLGLLPGKRKS